MRFWTAFTIMLILFAVIQFYEFIFNMFVSIFEWIKYFFIDIIKAVKE